MTKLDQTKTPILDTILKYGENIFKFDLTETPLLDDLHNPEGAISWAEPIYIMPELSNEWGI